MNNIIVHGIILIPLLESSLFSFDSRADGSVIGMLISSSAMAPMNIGYGDTETDSLNAERETMLTLDSS